MRPFLPLALAIVPGLALAQESKSVFDTPTVVLGFTSPPITGLLDADGDGDLDAFGDWTHPGDREFMRIQLSKTTGTVPFALNAWSEVIEEVGTQTKFALDTHVATGDLNGDGKGDVVIANRFFARLYAGTTGGLSLEQEWTGLPRVQGLVVADVDGEGGPEIVLLTKDDLRVLVLREGAWTTAAREDLPGSVPEDMLLALEAGGSPGSELAVIDSTSIRFFGYEDGALVGAGPGQVSRRGSRTGLGALGLAHGFPTFMGTAGDVTGDGLDDVVLFEPGGTYRVVRQTRPGSFRLDDVRVGGPATNLGDVDGDGDLDGLCCGGGGTGLPYPNLRFESNFEISINQGNGVFDPALQVKGSGATHLGGAADLDGDGDLDLAAGRVVLFNRGFECTPVQPATGTPGIQTASLYDVDGDGDLDASLTLTSVQMNEGMGSFTPAVPVVDGAPAGTTFLGPGIPGPFDGDAHPDLLVEHWQGGTFLGMRLLVNDGTGQFADGGPATGAGVAIHPVQNKASNVRLQDVDGDGDTDLITIVTGTANDGSQLWLNDGNGFFTAGADFSVASLGQAYHVLHVADFDGDGVEDALSTLLVPPGPFGGSATWNFEMHLGLPGGGFAAPFSAYQLVFGSPFSFGVDPTQDTIAVHDFTHDGFLDIVAYEVNDAYGAWLLEGTGSGFFWGYSGLGGMTASSCGETGNTVHMGDLNQDGLMDVVIGRIECEMPSVRVHLGTFPGTFQTSAWQLADPEALFDVDGDGDLDSYSGLLIRNQTVSGCGP